MVVVGGIQYSEGIGSFYACGSCGAAVASPAVHSAWHAGNDADALVASLRQSAAVATAGA